MLPEHACFAAVAKQKTTFSAAGPPQQKLSGHSIVVAAYRGATALSSSGKGEGRQEE